MALFTKVWGFARRLFSYVRPQIRYLRKAVIYLEEAGATFIRHFPGAAPIAVVAALKKAVRIAKWVLKYAGDADTARVHLEVAKAALLTTDMAALPEAGLKRVEAYVAKAQKYLDK